MALYRCIGNGGGATPTDITPSNSSPAAMSANGVYKATAAGYAVESVTNISPDTWNPPTLTTGEIYKATGDGVAVYDIQSITPSNSTPVLMTEGQAYKLTTAGGYAISDYAEKTPSASGVHFNAGMVKMLSDGYAFTYPHGYSDYINPASSISTQSTTFSLSNMSGRLLLVLLFYQAGSATAYNRLDGATATGGNLSKLCNLRNANGNAYGTFYTLGVTSDSCTITAPSTCFFQVFEAE
jgi:hypothetical protein